MNFFQAALTDLGHQFSAPNYAYVKMVVVPSPLEALSAGFYLQNFLEFIAYIIPHTVVLCQTPEDVVNKTTKHVEFSISEMKK